MELLFTNPGVIRGSREALEQPDDLKSLLSSSDTVFLLVCQGKSVVLTRDNELDDSCDCHSATQKEQQMKTLSIYESELTAATADNRSVVTGKTTQGPVSLVSSLQLDGTGLQELLERLKELRSNPSTTVDHDYPILALLGRSEGTKKRYYVCDVSHVTPSNLAPVLPFGATLVELRSIAHRIADPADAALLSISRGLALYHRNSTYCRRCGNRCHEKKHGTCRICSVCSAVEFPRQDPAIIILVYCGPYILLGRKPFWPAGRFSCIAGYAEIGESIEETALREVLEEANVQLDPASLLFRGSQPWLFPQALMFAFQGSTLNLSGPLAPERAEERQRGARPFLNDFPMSIPPITSGGFYIKGTTASTLVYLPCCTPDQDEMEEVLWFHVDFIRRWYRTSDPDRPVDTTPSTVASQAGEMVLFPEDHQHHHQSHQTSAPIPATVFHVPPRLSLAGHLISRWVCEKEFDSFVRCDEHLQHESAT